VSESLEERIAKLEAEVADLRSLMAAKSSPEPPPPPVVATLQPVSPPNLSPPAPVLPPYWAYHGPPLPPRSVEDSELDFGRKVMPIIGGLLLITALYYLTLFLMENIRLTRDMQFGLAATSSVAALTVGHWLRRGSPQVARALTVTGLFGGYFTIIAGSEPFGIYPDSTMVIAFFAFALVNVALGWLYDEEATSSLGVAAAFIAAFMAFERTYVYVALASAAALTGMALTLRRTWIAPVVIAGLGSLAVAGSLGLMATDRVPQEGVTHLLQTQFSLGMGLAWMAALRTSRQSELPVLAPFLGAMFLSIVLMFGPQRVASLPITLHVAAFAAVTVAMGAKWQSPWHIALGWFAAGIGVPLTIESPYRDWAWAIQAVAYTGLIWWRTKWFVIPFLATLGAMFRDSVVLNENASFLGWEIAIGLAPMPFVTAGVVLALVAYFGYVRRPAIVGEPENTAAETTYWLLVAGPTILQLALMVQQQFVPALDGKSLSAPLGASSTFAMLIGFRLQRLGPRFAAWVGILLLMGSLYLNELSELTNIQRIGILSVLGVLALLAGAYYYRRDGARSKDQSTGTP